MSIRALLALVCASPFLSAHLSFSDDSNGSVGVHRTASQVRARAPHLEAVFDERGVRFFPDLVAEAPTEPFLRIDAQTVGRTGGLEVGLAKARPEESGLLVTYARAPGIEERYETSAVGIEQSFLLHTPLTGSGDLVVRCALSGPLTDTARATDAGGFSFRGEYGGLELGAVTGIDADGRRCAGSMRVVGEMLELRLPEHFVDRASYPLLVDPLVGTMFPISTEPWFDERKPNIAYDRASQRYLVVWKWRFDIIAGQLLDRTGRPIGGVLGFGYHDGLMHPPQVANVSGTGRFLVGWIEEHATEYKLQVQSVDASDGTKSWWTTVAATPHAMLDLDIGGDSFGDQATLVWVDYGSGSASIVGALVSVPDGGDPRLFQNFTIAGGQPQHAYRDPSITRTPGLDASVVAYLYSDPSTPTEEIGAVAVAPNGAVLSAPLRVTTSNSILGGPKVDGSGFTGNNYALVYERQVPGAGEELVLTALNYDSGTLSMEPSILVHRASGLIRNYDVAVAPNRATVAWAMSGSLSLMSPVYMRDYDIPSGQSIGPRELVVAPRVSHAEVALSSRTSGGAAGTGEGLLGVAYGELDINLYGHLYDAFPNPGTVTDLGGSCGTGGTASTSGDASIGNGFFSFHLAGADPNASLGIFNLSGQATPISCGPCDWIPFRTIQVLGLTNGTARLDMAIPYDPSLIGVVIDTQWTTVTPGTSPCAPAPNASVSNRLRIVLGN